MERHSDGRSREASEAYLKSTWEDEPEYVDKIREELVQSAAVIVSHIECIDRAKRKVKNEEE